MWQTVTILNIYTFWRRMKSLGVDPGSLYFTNSAGLQVLPFLLPWDPFLPSKGVILPFNIYHSPTLHSFILRNADCHMQHLIWVCLEFWKLTTCSPTNTPLEDLEVLADECSYSETFTKEMSASFREGHPLLSVYSFRGEALGAMREEGYHSVHQISRNQP